MQEKVITAGASDAEVKLLATPCKGEGIAGQEGAVGAGVGGVGAGVGSVGPGVGGVGAEIGGVGAEVGGVRQGGVGGVGPGVGVGWCKSRGF